MQMRVALINRGGLFKKQRTPWWQGTGWSLQAGTYNETVTTKNSGKAGSYIEFAASGDSKSK